VSALPPPQPLKMATTLASAIKRRARSVFKLFIDKSFPQPSS